MREGINLSKQISVRASAGRTTRRYQPALNEPLVSFIGAAAAFPPAFFSMLFFFFFLFFFSLPAAAVTQRDELL